MADPLGARKVVVVGAAGFLGRACTRALAAAGARVTGVDVNEPAGETDEWFVADVLAHGVPADALAGADVLVNLAWRNDPGRGNADMEHDVTTNLAAAVRVFEQAARAGVRRLVYPSSGGTVYGRPAIHPTPEHAPVAPIGGYGAGKAAAELYLGAVGDAHGAETCVLRIANPYGPGQYPNRGQGFVATAIARVLAGLPIQIFGDAPLLRDYLFIDDVGEAVALAAAEGSRSLVLNVGSGVERSLEEVIALVVAATGRETRVERLPARGVDIPRMVLDVGRIKETLGWSAHTSMEDGLARTVPWIAALPPAGSRVR